MSEDPLVLLLGLIADMAQELKKPAATCCVHGTPPRPANADECHYCRSRVLQARFHALMQTAV